MAAIAVCTAFGNKSVERVFTWVSILLYGVYAAFVVFALSSFGSRISQTFASAGGWNDGWLSGGLTYAGYNIIGAVVILPVTRHLTSDRDAIVAGIAAGPWRCCRRSSSSYACAHSCPRLPAKRCPRTTCSRGWISRGSDISSRS